MIAIETTKSFAGVRFGSGRITVIEILGKPKRERIFEDHTIKLSFEAFDVFVNAQSGMDHVQVFSGIDAQIDELIDFDWSIDLVRELAKYDGDPRIGENGYVVKMRRIGVHALGFHLNNHSDFCIGFDSLDAIGERRYPSGDPGWSDF